MTNGAIDLLETDLIVEVTNMCDKSCMGCYAPNIIIGSKNFSTLNNIQNLNSQQFTTSLNDIIKLHPKLKTIFFRGGEPSLSSHFPELLEICSKKGFKGIVETHGRWLLNLDNAQNKLLLETIQNNGFLLKISADKMHATSYHDLMLMIEPLIQKNISYVIAVTETSVDSFNKWVQQINFPYPEKMIFQKLVSNEDELIKPRIGVLNAEGILKVTPTNKFNLNKISALFIFLSTLIFSSQSYAAKPAIPKINHVAIGIAANFSQMSDSTDNPYSNHFRNAFELALEEFRPQFKKRNLEVSLKEFDYGLNNSKILDTAVAAVDSNIVAMVGYIYSSHALLAAPILNNAKLPMITPTATADSIEKIGPYTWRTCFNDSRQGEVLARYSAQRGIRRVAIVSVSDCGYCQSLRKAFRENFQQHSGVIVEEIEILSKEDNFSSVVNSLKGANLDAIFLPNYEKISATIIQQLYDQGIRPKFWLGGDGWGNASELFFKIIHPRKINAYAISHWHKNLNTPLSKSFFKRYLHKFGKEPIDTSILTYDSARFIFLAVLRSKTYSRNGLYEALNSVESFDGITGKINFTKESRTPNKAAVILKLENEKVSLVGTRR